MTYLLIVAAGLCVFVYLVYELIKAKDQQVTQLQAQLEKTQAELEALKERKRQTGPTQAGLLDALAALQRVQVNREIEKTILDSCRNTLIQVNQGPYAYDPNRPSGERKEFE